jgi:dienelactone hydrolase
MVRRLTCLGACLVLLFAGTGCERLVDGLRSQAPPAGGVSAARLAPGPFEVATLDFAFVDASRPTMANGDVPAASSRTLGVTVWVPADADGARPLLVYAHGFTGNRREMVYMLEHVASHGYVVAGLDFPLTNGEAPGGPNSLDLGSQPGDVRFVIDSVLAENEAGGSLAGRIDPGRIGLAGLSYGGLTTTLVAFHPGEADPRVRGAISIAGPTQMFTPVFFSGGGPPFLMIAGTEDALVPHALNAVPLPAKAPGSELLTLDAGTHLGFVDFAELWMRFSYNPDATACERIGELGGSELGGGEEPGNPFEMLGTVEDGIDAAAWVLPCQGDQPIGKAMRPARQHLITSLAVRAFLDSLFAKDPALRAEARDYLRSGLPGELPDARYSAR